MHPAVFLAASSASINPGVQTIYPSLSAPGASEPLAAGTTHKAAPVGCTPEPRDHPKREDRRRYNLPSCGLSSPSIALPVERVPRADAPSRRGAAGHGWAGSGEHTSELRPTSD